MLAGMLRCSWHLDAPIYTLTQCRLGRRGCANVQRASALFRYMGRAPAPGATRSRIFGAAAADAARSAMFIVRLLPLCCSRLYNYFL